MGEPDWLSPTFNAQLFSIAQALIWVSCGAAIVDAIRFAPFDWQVITGKRERKWMMVFYFGTKFAWWSFMLINIIELNTLYRIDCQAGMDAIEFMMGMLAVCSSALMACRTACLYDGLAGRKTRLFVRWSLILSGLAMLATWLAGVNDVEMAWVVGAGGPWREGACQFVAVPSRYMAKYIITVIFDFYVVVLTLLLVRRLHQGTGRISGLLKRQGLGYFLLTGGCNLTVCILCLLQRSPLLSLIGALPSACICFLASTRLFVALSETARPRDGVAETLDSEATSSDSRPEKLQSFLPFRRSGRGSSKYVDAQDSTEDERERSAEKPQSLRKTATRSSESCASTATLSPWRSTMPLLPFHKGQVKTVKEEAWESELQAKAMAKGLIRPAALSLSQRSEPNLAGSAHSSVHTHSHDAASPTTPSPLSPVSSLAPSLRRPASVFSLGNLRNSRDREGRHMRSVSYHHLPRHCRAADQDSHDAGSFRNLERGVTIRRSTEVRSERILPPFTSQLFMSTSGASGSEPPSPADKLTPLPTVTSASPTRARALEDREQGDDGDDESYAPMRILSRDQQELHRFRRVQQRIDEEVEQKSEKREKRRKEDAEKARVAAVMDALRAHPRASSATRKKRPSTAP